MTITASEFKAKCLRLMEQVRATGEAITITKRGAEIARLTPPAAKEKLWETLRGTGVLLASPDESFLADADFDAFTGRGLDSGKRKRRAKR